jgi:hypothetical protein
MHRVVVTEHLTLDGVMQAPAARRGQPRWSTSRNTSPRPPWPSRCHGRNSALLDGDAAEAVVIVTYPPARASAA